MSLVLKSNIINQHNYLIDYQLLHTIVKYIIR